MICRLIVPIPRKSIPQDILSQSIPSLSERQYVVDKEKKSASRIALERELFWYREALLDMLDLIWTEVRLFPSFFIFQSS